MEKWDAYNSKFEKIEGIILIRGEEKTIPKGILALAEATNPCDIEMVHKMKWETMTFNAFDLGSKEAVDTAFRVLSDGGVGA